MNRLLPVILAIMILLLSGCNNEPKYEGTIKIGVFQSLTGENGAGGTTETMGTRYGNLVRPTVTIDGKTYLIELVEADNKSNTEEALIAAQKLIDEDISVAIGSYGSSVSIAAGPLFAQAEIPIIGASCTNPNVTLGNDWYFRVCNSDDFQGEVMASYAWDEGISKVALVYQVDDWYSRGMAEYFAEAFKHYGGEIVLDAQYTANQVDFTQILDEASKADAEMIFAPSSVSAAMSLISQAAELEGDILIAGGDTYDASEIRDFAGEAAEGIIFTTFFHELGGEGKEAEDFIPGFKKYLSENGHAPEVTAISALGYDAYLAAITAIENAGSHDPAAIRNALENISFEGVTGEISFNENGDKAKAIAYVMTIEAGAIVPLSQKIVD